MVQSQPRKGGAIIKTAYLKPLAAAHFVYTAASFEEIIF
jgi:hypothetical protein